MMKIFIYNDNGGILTHICVLDMPRTDPYLWLQLFFDYNGILTHIVTSNAKNRPTFVALVFY